MMLHDGVVWPQSTHFLVVKRPTSNRTAGGRLRCCRLKEPVVFHQKNERKETVVFRPAGISTLACFFFFSNITIMKRRRGGREREYVYALLHLRELFIWHKGKMGLSSISLVKSNFLSVDGVKISFHIWHYCQNDLYVASYITKQRKHEWSRCHQIRKTWILKLY